MKWHSSVRAIGLAGILVVAVLLPVQSRGEASTMGAESSIAEPMDGEILRAVIDSMRQYYARRAAAHRLTKRDEEMVCYEHLGCFRDEGPFDYLDVLPLSPENIRTDFLLYTRRNPDQPIHLHYGNASSLSTSHLRHSSPVKVIVHGFGSSCQKQWATDLRQALLRAEDVNVVCVDWEAGAALPHYVQAAANTRLVGRQVARFIASLNHLRGTNNSQFHLIGFSLGAHVAGFAGYETGNISRITGLDPAAPLFEGYSNEARLDSSDANFVDVIHSNGDSLLYGGLGAFDAMGHADYYPNGGKVQAGCSNIFVGAISDLIWHQPRSVDGQSLCNHRRAYKFFMDSVLENCIFPAFACRDYEELLRGECFPCEKDKQKCGNMGYFADRSPGRGKLYLLTRNSEPFCANQFKVIIESSSNLAPTYGALDLTLIDRNHLNETFQVTSEWEQLVPGKSLTRVIVAHPAMTELVSAKIRYTPYKGWIMSGLERWAVDRLVIVDSFGKRYSLCRKGVPLAEHKPTIVYLNKKDCDAEVAVPSPAKDEFPPAVILNVGRLDKYGVHTPSPAKKSIVKDVIKNTVAGDSQNSAEEVWLGLSPEIGNPILYFRASTTPNASTSLPTASEEVTREGVVYNVGHSKGGLEHWHKWQPPKTLAKFGIVGWRPVSSRRGVDKHPNRLSRKLSFNGNGHSPGSIPAVRAQIMFVPRGLPRRRVYIPLRSLPEKKRRNLSSHAWPLQRSMATTTPPPKSNTSPWRHPRPR